MRNTVVLKFTVYLTVGAQHVDENFDGVCECEDIADSLLGDFIGECDPISARATYEGVVQE